MEDPKQYQVGELTMEYVFRQSGLTNLSDMQAVLDAMEAALRLKNRHYREAMAEKNEEISAMRNGY